MTFFAATGAPSTPVTVVVSDVPLSSMPLENVSGSFSDSLSITPNDYYYESLFLNTGSTFNYTFTCSEAMDFLVMDGADLSLWEQNSPSYFAYLENTSTLSASVQVVPSFATSGVPISQDYYLVWWNDASANTVTVSLTIAYTRDNVYDFTNALYHQEDVNSVPTTTVTLPSTGTWYFIVYFDPWNTDQSSTVVTYQAQVTAPGGLPPLPIPLWALVTIIVVVVIVVIVIISVSVARSRTRRRFANAPPGTFTGEEIPGQPGAQGSQQPTTVAYPGKMHAARPTIPPPASGGTCEYCGAPLNLGAKFCSTCGREQIAQPAGPGGVTTPRSSKFCSLCGAELEEGAQFCQSCGTKVEQ
jgi:hypothetical protein